MDDVDPFGLSASDTGAGHSPLQQMDFTMQSLNPELLGAFGADPGAAPGPATSPAATSAGSASAMSSPQLGGAAPYSSIAQTLGSAAQRSRSASSTSPHPPQTIAPELLTPASVGTSASQTSGYSFPTASSAPTFDEPQKDPHQLALEDMLHKILKTAGTALDAVQQNRMGTGASKVGELKRSIDTINSMMHGMNLADPVPATPPSGSDAGGSDGGAGAGESRKRCASQVAEGAAAHSERVPKALKLEHEPADATPLPPFSAPPSAGLPLGSAPASRPASSHGFPAFHAVPFAGGGAGVPLSMTGARSAYEFGQPFAHDPWAQAPQASGSAAGFVPRHGAPGRGSFSGDSLAGMGVGVGGAMGLPLGALDMHATGLPSFPAQSRMASRSNSHGAAGAHPFAFAAGGGGALDERMDTARPGTGHGFGGAGAYGGGTPSEDEDEDDAEDAYAGRFYRSRGGSGTDGGASNPGSFGGSFASGARRRPVFEGLTPGAANQSALQQSQSSSHGAAVNEVPAEYRAEVDRVFFDFLNKICSNLDATDSKGEPIHQTLMAKKMQRLDESPDFRPFKFRIQAFTNAFLEELARQGYPEDKIPMKKIRNYLWNSPYISRFNEDGKKAKSKGNHIWNIEAKKVAPEGSGGHSWAFQPFHRRLAGGPPGVAYAGLRWTWAPRIWDPQASRANLPVHFSSPALPSWLKWSAAGDTLEGVPPPDAQSCDVTVEARFIQDGKEELLTQTVHISIAPMSSVDISAFGGPPSRRPSLSLLGERRIQSDSAVAVAQRAPPPLPRTATGAAAAAAAAGLPHAGASHDTQVIQVLATAAQRVAAEAHVVHPAAGGGSELQALQKQQHVLTVTAQAVDSSVAASGRIAAQPGNVLAAAAQQVVLSAARKIGGAGGAQVTVNEVSVATQSAVAQAVELVGPVANEVDVMRTANSLLVQHTPADPFAGLQAQLGGVGVGVGRPGSSRGASFATGLPTVQEFNPVLGGPLVDMSVGAGFAGHS